MNKRLYRIVFNDTRGQLMVVAETATGDGKAASGGRPDQRPAAPYWATLRALSLSLLAALGLAVCLPPAAHAQIVAYRSAPGNQQPTVLSAGNGVPLINIQTPSAAGVSRNSYSQFDVQPAGAILNNARTSAQTQLGGWVQGNPWLATGSARVVLNQVTSANPSLLRGYVEVAGSNAQVVIANPAGVTCAGCGFINANRVTLATGTPIVGGGNLDGYRVEGGTIRVEGAGLDASRVDYTDLIARSVEINAGVWAKDLKVTTGANQVDAANVLITPIAGSAAAPAFAIDVARLGGMYANKIVLVGTEAGVGVRNAGTIGAAAGEVVVTADGKLVNPGTLISGDHPLTISTRGLDNAGTVSSERDLTLASVGDVANSGLIHAGRELTLDTDGQLTNRQGTIEGQRLAIRADRLANDGGTLRQNGTQALAVSAGQVGNAAGALIGNVLPTSGASVAPAGSANAPAVAEGVATAPTTSGDGAVAVVPATTAGLADGLVAVRGDLHNTGTIAASGAVSLSAGAGLSNAGTLALNRLDVSGDSARNSGAIAATSARLAAALLDNSGGTLLVADQLDIAAHDVVNAQGTLRHSGVDALTVALEGSLDNRSGQIASNGVDLKVSAAAVDNTGGRIEHAGDGTLSLATKRLDGSGGRIESRGALVIAAADTLLDGASTLGATFAIAANTLSNQGGSIAQTGRGSGSVTVAGRFDNSAGSVANIGSLAIAAGELDNRGGGKIASNGDLVLTTTTGALTNDGGTVSSQGRLDARIASELTNTGGQIVAGTDLGLTTGVRVDNTGGTQGAVAGRVYATLGGALDNSGGRIEAATGLILSSDGLTNVGGTVLGQSVVIDTRQQSFDNNRGTVSSGGALSVASGTLTNVAGRLQAVGALTVDSHGQAIANTGGGDILGQASVVLSAAALDNSAGVIGAADSLTLTAASLTNRAGRITQNGTVSGPIAVAGRLDNTGGLLASAASLNLSAGEIDNRGGGQIAANGDLALTTTTGALTNDGGTVSSQGRLDARIASELTNTGGQIVAGTDLALTTGGRVDNTGGTLGAVAGRLDATLGGALDNTDGRVEAATGLILSSNGLSNIDGTLLGQSVAIDTRQQDFDNTRGTVSAGGALSVASGTLTNVAGRLQAAGALIVDSHGQALANTGGGNILGQASVALSAGALDNSAGLIASADTLAVAASRLVNVGGRLSAQNGMTLNAGAALDNRGGDIQSGGDLAAAATVVDNGGGLMRAAATLSIGADRLANAGTKVGDQGLEGRSLIVAANAIDNRDGALRATDALTVRSAGTLDNSNGLISSERTLAIRDESAVRTLVVTHTGGTIIAGTDLAIRAEHLTGDGRILSHGDLTVDLVADFVNASEITADRNASVVTAGTLTNRGTLQAGSTLAVQAATLDNTAAGKIAAGTLQLQATAIHNRGLIDGGDTFIDAVAVDNLGSGRLYGDLLAIAATTVGNHPEDGVAPVIAARERLDIGAGTIDNRDGALIFSGGELAIGGALDASHRAIGQASAVTNASATIEALGNLAIDTASLINRKTAFATTRIASGTPTSAIALLDYAPDLKFHWPFMKIGTAPWRSLILERYLNAIDKLLGGGPGAALVAAYNADSLYLTDLFVNVWGDLTGYTGPIGGGLDETYRSRLAAVVNAPAPMAFDDSHKVWQLLVETIAAEHPEYLDRMVQALAAQGPLQQAYRQICIDTDDCDYVANVVSTSVSQRDVVSADSPAAVIRAGGNAAINASALENHYSVIQSGGDMTLTGATLTNVGAELYLLTDTTSTSRLWHWMSRDQGSTTSASSTQTLIGSAPAIISAGGALTGSFSNRIDNISVRQNAARVVGQTGSTPGISGVAGVGLTAAGAGTVQTVSGTGEAVSSTAGSSSANTASTFGAAPARITRVAAAGPNGVVATAALALALPASRLLHVNPDPAGRYLVETDPAFASYRTWLSSDYLLGALALDPATTQKRLGDGFYEQRLILEQVAELTGRRFLSGYASDEAQYRALMAAGATVARQWQLVPGVALSEAQMARLTTDIVWLVKREVTLADGTLSKVLVPQVYARVRDGDLDASGALIAANDVRLETAGEIVTSGTIAGRQVVALTAENIADLRGRIAGGDVAVQAAHDLTVLGGSIEAERTLLASAGNNLTVASTTVDRDYQNDSTGTANSVKQTTIDRVAGLYVTGPGGTLVASAGNDLKLLAAVVSNAAAAGADSGAGQTLLAAGKDLILGTVSERSQAKTVSEDVRWSSATRNEFGTAIQSSGDLTLVAGQDLTARAASVGSSEGALSARAGRDLTIEAGQSSYEMTYDSQTRRGGFLSSRSSSQHDAVSTTTAQSSTFSGDTVALRAGQDIAIRGSNVVSDQGTILVAQRNLSIESAQETRHESHFKEEKESGIFGSGGVGFTIGSRQLSVDQQYSGTSAVASTVGSTAGNVTLLAGQDYRQDGSDVLAPHGDIDILAKKVDIIEAQNTYRSSTETKSKQSGFTLTLSNPAITAIQTAQQMRGAASETKDARMKALAAAATALEAKSAYDAVASNPGQAGGINVSISLGSSQSQSNSVQTGSNAAGSTVSAGCNITIGASGAGRASDLTIQGSRITAGNNVRLQADDAIELLAAKNIADQYSNNQSSSASVGIGFSLGSSQNGFTINVGVSGTRGQADGNDLAWTNTQVNAGKQLTLDSGGDTTLKGAVARGEQVVATVGGSLTIESLQDQSRYASQQDSFGVGVSLCIPPFCYGTSSASITSNQNTAKSAFISVIEQSGIKTGDGGFQVEVKGNTDLKGAVIASTPAAVDHNKNSLTTGTLTTSDIQNRADASADSSGISLSSDMFTQGKYGVTKGVIGNALNDTSKSGSSSGQTRSAVSAASVTIVDEATQLALTGKTAEEMVAGLNRDTANAHTAAQKQDIEAMQRTVQAEQAIRTEAIKIVTALTDETYRSRFLTQPAIIKVECPAGADCNTDPSKLQRSLATATEIRNAEAGSILVVNGLLNDESRAAELGYQNVVPDKETGNKPSTIYVMHIAPANNTISELLGAAYEKIVNSMDYGLANFLGYTNGAELYADLLRSRGQNATESLGHSRGTLIQESAFTILRNRPDDTGTPYTNSNLTMRGVGGAANAVSWSQKAAAVQGPGGEPGNITYNYFSNDPVATSIFLGGNPGVWTLKDLWQVINTNNSMHSCYGTGAAGCTQVEIPMPGSPIQGTPEGNAKLIQYEDGKRIDNNPIGHNSQRGME